MKLLCDLISSCKNLEEIYIQELLLEEPNIIYKSLTLLPLLTRVKIFARSKHEEDFIDMLNDIPQTDLRTFWYISPLDWGVFAQTFFHWIGSKRQLRELNIGGSSLSQRMFPYTPFGVTTLVYSSPLLDYQWPHLRSLTLESLGSASVSNHPFWEKHSEIRELCVTSMDMKNFPFNALPKLEKFKGELNQLVALTKSITKGRMVLRPIKSVSIIWSPETAPEQIERLALFKLEEIEFREKWDEENILSILSMLLRSHLRVISTENLIMNGYKEASEWIGTLGRFPELKRFGEIVLNDEVTETFVTNLQQACKKIEYIGVWKESETLGSLSFNKEPVYLRPKQVSV
eukprot:TRINITY_DN5616_c0_g1_i2.p1 TRINITY_DN5616_c0_g1~~TRINITY_DN5616_c0_g1_i2.p1  ORF type:complete len:345 (+),score=82.28 TRINITY_DN5616_c0_g1_i2:424-1458(+)